MSFYPVHYLSRILLLVFFCWPFCSQAQNSNIQSLRKRLNMAMHDTEKVSVMLNLSDQFYYLQVDSGEKYAMQALDWCNLVLPRYEDALEANLLYKKGIACYNAAYFLEQKGFIEKARELLILSLASLDLAYNKEPSNEILKQKAYSLSNLGILLDDKGEIEQSLKYAMQGLQIQEKLNDWLGAAASLNNIGYTFVEQGDLIKGEEFFLRGIELHRKAGDRNGAAMSMNNLGSVYYKVNNYSKSVRYFNLALSEFENLKDWKGKALVLTNKGKIYKDRDLFDSALYCYQQSLRLRESIKDVNGQASTLNIIGKLYLSKKRYKEAEQYSYKSFCIAKELGFPSSIETSASTLFKIYRGLNNYREALKYYELYIQMRDSIKNEETKKASIKSQLKYEYEKKSAADSVKAAEEKKVVDAQLKQEKTQRLALYGGLGLVGIFAMFMVNRFRVTNKQKKLIEEQKRVVESQKHLVEEKQKEIIDSITYARRIQRALITNEYYIVKMLSKLKFND